MDKSYLLGSWKQWDGLWSTGCRQVGEGVSLLPTNWEKLRNPSSKIGCVGRGCTAEDNEVLGAHGRVCV